ncbi:unnamed protein product, partial [Mesorhabditis belari]|uniref:C-type lectin domain-containing protein n=1 Tax=Mesorhabditis belari TaxID=2138241 RepID=A0AAF3JAJ5_9BILA
MCLNRLATRRTQYYPRAVRECNKLGGDVVKIENIFENSILFGLLGEYFNEAAAYIGVEKLPNGTWVYSDGARLTYTNWAPGQPTSTINATICAIIDPQTAQWRAAECSIARPFYCQIDGNQAECDPGWVYFDKTDSCYYLHNFTLQDGFHWQLYSWDDAEGNCRQMNSHLISIHTTDEDEFVYDLVHTTFPADPNPDPAPTDQNFEVSAFIGDIMISLIRPIFLMQIRIVIFQMSWDLPFVGIMIALVSLRSNKLYQGFEGGYGIAIFLSYGCFMNGSLYKIITLYSLPSYVAWLLNVYFLGGYGAVFVLGATFMLNILRTGGLSDDRKVVGDLVLGKN